MTGYLFVLAVGIVAGSISGIVGSGASILLLPVLVWQFGPLEAVPIMAVSAVLSNIGKATAWWRDVDWKVFAAYAIPGVPAAALGARTLLVLPPNVIEMLLGAFFMLMVPVRRWMQKHNYCISLWALAVAGALIGFLSGIVLSTGPLSIPAFAAAGLLKGALLSTEAIASLALMVSKVATFQQMGALPTEIVFKGAIIGTSVMLGTWVGKWVVNRMSMATFEYLLDGMLLLSGAALLYQALTG